MWARVTEVFEMLTDTERREVARRLRELDDSELQVYDMTYFAIRSAVDCSVREEAMESKVMYEVEVGVDGYGWSDGAAYASLAAAKQVFEEELSQPSGSSHCRKFVRLNKVVAHYEDGELFEVEVVSVMREERV